MSIDLHTCRQTTTTIILQILENGLGSSSCITDLRMPSVIRGETRLPYKKMSYGGSTIMCHSPQSSEKCRCCIIYICLFLQCHGPGYSIELCRNLITVSLSKRLECLHGIFFVLVSFTTYYVLYPTEPVLWHFGVTLSAA